MKKIIVLAVVMVLAGTGVSYAQLWKKSSPKAVQQERGGALSTEQMEESLNTKKAELLEGTEWTIKLTPMGSRGRAETDVLMFVDGKVVSKNLEGRGYGASNYTVRLQDDGAFTWETMQRSEKDGVAFWRGDIKDGIMRGVFSKKDKNNNNIDFNFVSTSSQVSGKPAPVAVAAAEEQK
jgi:hypothetical protein